jgi:hypothetical protein
MLQIGGTAVPPRLASSTPGGCRSQTSGVGESTRECCEGGAAFRVTVPGQGRADCQKHVKVGLALARGGVPVAHNPTI